MSCSGWGVRSLFLFGSAQYMRKLDGSHPHIENKERNEHD